MSDNSRALGAILAGAVIGGLAGYFFFTERGRGLRRQIEPALEDLGRELNSFRQTVEKASAVANEGWQLLNEAMESGSRISRYSMDRSPYPTDRQTSPF